MPKINTKLVWFIDHPLARIWSVNPYKRCAFRCVYCIANSQGAPEPWFGPDHIKQELEPRLEEIPPDQEISVGGLVDAYPPEEEALGVTRIALGELSRQGRPFCVNTKSALVRRDTDILLAHRAHCDVCLSVSCLDEDAITVLEPGAPPVAERLDAALALHHAGIDVYIDAAPWIPGLGDIGALRDRLPDGVGIQVAPLDIRHHGAHMTLAGRHFTQEEIDMAYQEHRKALASTHAIVWKDAV